jgi:hypothetical protein
VVSGKSHPSTVVHKNCKIPNGGNHAHHIFLERFQKFYFLEFNFRIKIVKLAKKWNKKHFW